VWKYQKGTPLPPHRFKSNFARILNPRILTHTMSPFNPCNSASHHHCLYLIRSRIIANCCFREAHEAAKNTSFHLSLSWVLLHGDRSVILGLANSLDFSRERAPVELVPLYSSLLIVLFPPSTPFLMVIGLVNSQRDCFIFLFRFLYFKTFVNKFVLRGMSGTCLLAMTSAFRLLADLNHSYHIISLAKALLKIIYPL
jgi:hypothetical protein